MGVRRLTCDTMKKPSLYPTDEGCFLCGNPETHTHHIFPGNGRRSVSDAEGCTVKLCPAHHNMSSSGVHFNRKLDNWLRADCERKWEEREGIEDPDHVEFIKLFGRNYL